MEQPPPLTPQEVATMQASENIAIGQPQTVKVFGIMHCVLGAYGVLTTIIAVFALVGFNPLLALIPKTPGATAQMNQQAAMQAEMMPASIATALIGLVTTVFILMAGTLMLKRRRSGLKWSNRYAWTSLFGKFVSALVVVFLTYPMMKKTTSGAGAPGMPGGMEWVVLGSMVLGVVIACVYPILTLVVLNRPTTKAWFANRPG